MDFSTAFADLFPAPGAASASPFVFSPSQTPVTGHAGHSLHADSVEQDSSPRLSSPASPSIETAQHQLNFLPFDQWRADQVYDGQPPDCLRYFVEWKIVVNKKSIWTNTEQNVVLAPYVFVHEVLQPRIDVILQKKLPSSKRVGLDDIKVVVSVNERGERDLTKRYDEGDLEWTEVDQQLVGWSDLLLAGKKLRVQLAFHYVDCAQNTARATPVRGAQRGRRTATQRMLGTLAAEVEQDEAAGRPVVWQQVYSLMRCPGPPCQLGPHCWRDPHGKQHYRLRADHLRQLIRHVEAGGQLDSHEDVPDDLRNQLYTEQEQQRQQQQHISRKRRGEALSPYTMPPVHITNVLPSHTQSSPRALSPEDTNVEQDHTFRAMHATLGLTGPRDVLVQEYSEWQQGQVHSEIWKEQFRAAGEVVLANGIDLDLLEQRQQIDLLIEHGLKIGIAQQFVRDVPRWAEERRQHRGQDSILSLQ